MDIVPKNSLLNMYFPPRVITSMPCLQHVCKQGMHAIHVKIGKIDSIKSMTLKYPNFLTLTLMTWHDSQSSPSGRNLLACWLFVCCVVFVYVALC